MDMFAVDECWPLLRNADTSGVNVRDAPLPDREPWPPLRVNWYVTLESYGDIVSVEVEYDPDHGIFNEAGSAVSDAYGTVVPLP